MKYDNIYQAAAAGAELANNLRVMQSRLDFMLNVNF